MTKSLRARVEDFEKARAAIEEREKAEQALRENQQLLMGVVENSPSVIFVKARDGRYLLINERFEALFQSSRESLVGKTDEEMFPPDAAAEIRQKDLAVMAGARIVQFEEDLPSPEGLRTYLTIKFPIRDAHGNVTGLCGIATDITARKRAEEEARRLQEEVIAAQRIALHELSTPLMPIAQGVIVMPLVGVIDSVRAAQILETLLHGVTAQRAHTAILDVTGVRSVDTQVANAIVNAAKAVRLLGARVLLTGIGPGIAQTLVGLGADLGDITTLSTLQSGIAHALKP